MAKKSSRAVEILPGPTVEWLVGSVKTSTARVCKNGRNILMPKVKQPNKIGADPNMFKLAGEKWRAMTEAQKQPWKEIATNKEFRCAWNAFNSSFFRSVAIYGMDHTMNHELSYINSNHRSKKAEHLRSSLKRLNQYQQAPESYVETAAILDLHPVALSSEHVQLHLQDLNDVNNALLMKWLYRTDAFIEYEFTALEQDQHSETGHYTMTKRPRQSQELYQMIQATSCF